MISASKLQFIQKVLHLEKWQGSLVRFTKLERIKADYINASGKLYIKGYMNKS